MMSGTTGYPSTLTTDQSYLDSASLSSISTESDVSPVNTCSSISTSVIPRGFFNSSGSSGSSESSYYSSTETDDGIDVNDESLLTDGVFGQLINLTKFLGGGSFGRVYQGVMKKDTNLELIVKFIRKKGRFRQEIEILEKVKFHPNIVECLRVLENNDFMQILMRKHGDRTMDFQSFIYNSRWLTENCARFFFKQLASALHHIHALNIAHLDIKPENIIINQSLELQMIDFGLSVDTSTEGDFHTGRVGSKPYMSPEMLHNQRFHAKLTDVWSMSVTFFEAYFKQLPFRVTYPDLTLGATGKPVTRAITGEIRNLLDGMMRWNVRNRFTMDDVINHTWFQGSYMFDRSKYDIFQKTEPRSSATNRTYTINNSSRDLVATSSADVSNAVNETPKSKESNGDGMISREMSTRSNETSESFISFNLLFQTDTPEAINRTNLAVSADECSGRRIATGGSAEEIVSVICEEQYSKDSGLPDWLTDDDGLPSEHQNSANEQTSSNKERSPPVTSATNVPHVSSSTNNNINRNNPGNTTNAITSCEVTSVLQMIINADGQSSIKPCDDVLTSRVIANQNVGPATPANAAETHGNSGTPLSPCNEVPNSGINADQSSNTITTGISNNTSTAEVNINGDVAAAVLITSNDEVQLPTPKIDINTNAGIVIDEDDSKRPHTLTTSQDHPHASSANKCSSLFGRLIYNSLMVGLYVYHGGF